jgi:hypothetical protein
MSLLDDSALFDDNYVRPHGARKSSRTPDEIEQWVKTKGKEYYRRKDNITAPLPNRGGLFDYLRLHEDPIVKRWFSVSGTHNQVDKLWNEIKEEALDNLGKKSDDGTLKIQTVAELVAREFPPKDYLLGEYIHTGSRVLMFAVLESVKHYSPYQWVFI